MKSTTRMSGIYKIENLINNKFYIGSSVDINRRWNEHKRDLRKQSHINKYLQNSWNKYGANAFRFSVIEVVEDSTMLLDREQYYLDTMMPYDKKIGFNINAYSTAGRLGRKHTLETKNKIGNAHRGRKYSNEIKLKMKKAQQERAKHYVASEETRRKHSLNSKGRKHTEKAKKAIADSKRGSKNATSVLDETQVKEIKLLLKLSNLTENDIAAQYGVTFQTVNDIKRGLIWTHVEVTDEDRLDYQLAYFVHYTNSIKKKPEIGVQQYLLVKEYLNKGFKNAEISRSTGIRDKRISDIRNGIVSKKLKRDLELYYLNLEGKIYEDPAIYEQEYLSDSTSERSLENAI